MLMICIVKTKTDERNQGLKKIEIHHVLGLWYILFLRWRFSPYRSIGSVQFQSKPRVSEFKLDEILEMYWGLVRKKERLARYWGLMI